MKSVVGLFVALGLGVAGCERDRADDSTQQGVTGEAQQERQPGTGTGETGGYGTQPDAYDQSGQPDTAQPGAPMEPGIERSPQGTLPEQGAQPEFAPPAPSGDVAPPPSGTEDGALPQDDARIPGEYDVAPQKQPGAPTEPVDQAPQVPDSDVREGDPMDQGAGLDQDAQSGMGATARRTDATETGEDTAVTGRGAATTGVGVIGSGEAYSVAEGGSGNTCERVLRCYERLSNDLCAQGDAACRGLFQVSGASDERTCRARLSVVRETARPFISNPTEYELPAECAAPQQ